MLGKTGMPPMDFMIKSYPNGTSVVIYTEDITKIKVRVTLFAISTDKG